MKPPQLSDEAIRSYMDFGSIMQQRKKILDRRSVLRWTAGVGATVVLVALISWPLLNGDQKQKPQLPQTSSIPLPLGDSTKVHSGNDNSHHKPIDQVIIPEQEDNYHRTEADKKSKPAETESSGIENQKEKIEPAADPDRAKVADVYVQAEPVEGYEALYRYINENLHYPPEALSDSVQGAVMVTFVITPEGKADQITLENNLGPAFASEVTNLIQNMPAWKPATLNGTPVPSRITLPLTFHVQRITK